MASGSRNQLTKQIGEYLVCAELARRGFYATPFAGNVPLFDVLASDDTGRIVRIQVKATRSDNWPTDARSWMEISLDGNRQVYRGVRALPDPSLIYVCVAIADDKARDHGQPDRFFILRAADLQRICVDGYSRWMDGRGWARPRNPESYDCRYGIPDLTAYENNWRLLNEPTA